MSAQIDVTHTSSVTPDQIDHLGHMNVRYYGVNARHGTDEVLRRLGAALGDGIELSDVYTRHLAEQLEGAKLEVRSGVIEATSSSVRIYHELANQETDALAATFVHNITPSEGLALPADFVAAAEAVLIEVPAHGQPRTIVLKADPTANAPTLPELLDGGFAMRKPREIAADECNEDGSYMWSSAPFLTWGGEPIDGTASGPHLLDGPNGEKMGWAAMESRMVIHRLPRLGDRIQSFGALVEMFSKGTHRVQWAFDLDTGDLLISFEVVNLAFDTGARRAMVIPDNIREREMRIHAPQYLPK